MTATWVMMMPLHGDTWYEGGSWCLHCIEGDEANEDSHKFMRISLGWAEGDSV